MRERSVVWPVIRATGSTTERLRSKGLAPTVRAWLLAGFLLGAVLAGLPGTVAPGAQAQVGESSCVTSSQRDLHPEQIALGEVLTVSLRLQASCPDYETPLHVAFVVDVSGSMAGDRLDRTRDTLNAVVDALDLADHPETRIAVIAFNDVGTTLCELGNQVGHVQACLSQLEANGGSAVQRGLLEGLKTLRQGRNLHQGQVISEVMLLLTDGADDSGCQALLSAASQVKSQGILLVSACVADSCDAACVRLCASSASYFYGELDEAALVHRFRALQDDAVGRASFRQLEITDRLPPNMEFVANSANPPADFDAHTNGLTWRQNFVPAEGVTISFQIRPLEVGTHPTSLGAQLVFRDSLNRRGRADFPIEDVVVVPGVPTPTAEPVPELDGRLEIDLQQLVVGQRAEGAYALDFELPEPAGDTHLALVLDQSGSMAGPSINRLQEGVELMFDRLEPLVTPERFAASVVAFSNVTQVLCELTGDFARLRACTAALDPAGGTDIDLGIDAGLASLRAGRPWDGGEDLVVFSDGANNQGCAPLLAAADRAKAEEVIVHSVCLGGACDEACMRNVASSPRHYFKVDEAGDLPLALGGIADDLLARRGVESVDLELRLPEHLALLPQGFSIQPDEQDQRSARWTLQRMPATGLGLAFELEARGAGVAPLEMDATIHRLGGQPLSDKQSSEPIEVPGTPTQTTPTPPEPGETPTPTQDHQPTYGAPDRGPIYLPLLLREACAGGAPSDIVLVFDSSLSMAERFGPQGSKLDAAREGAGALIARLGAEDRIALVGFDAEPRTLQAFTRDEEALLGALEGIELARGTAIDAGVDRATDLLLASPRRAAVDGEIVLISNGRALESDPQAAVAAAERARGYKFRIRAVGLGREVDEPTLQAIAGSGEDYRRVEAADEAHRALDRLGRDLECALESSWGRR